MKTKRSRVAFIMPRYAHDHVRIVHKEATAFKESGCEVVLVCDNPPPDNMYLGMLVVKTRSWSSTRFGVVLSTPLLLRQAVALQPDMYVLTNPFSLPIGALLAVLRRRVVYVTHEDFCRKAEIRPYIPRQLRNLVGRTVVAMEGLLARLATAMIATQPDVCARYPNCKLIENAPLTRGPIVAAGESERAKLPRDPMPSLIYAGIITRDRGLFRMLDLIDRLNMTRPWRLKLVGTIFPAADHARARAHTGWRFVEEIGQVSHALSLAHISNSNFGLGLLEDVGGYSQASMTKLYEYMAMGTPFVVSDFKRWRDSIKDVAAGLFVEPNDIARIAAEIEALYGDGERYEAMRTTGRTFIEQHFSWEIISQPLRDLAAGMRRPVEP